MQIKTLHVDFEGKKSLKGAVKIENEHVDSLKEIQQAALKPVESLNQLESVDDEVISYAIQQFKDDSYQEQTKFEDSESSSIISVFLNEEFYKNFELHRENRVVHTVNVIEEE